MGSGRRALALATVCIAAVFVVRAWPTLPSVVDDAWISARYARNFALGDGLVYNAGEPPVEGYTNLAWVLLLAIGYRLEADMHGAMVGLGLVFGVLGLPAAAWLTRQLETKPSLWCLAPAALLAVDPHYGVVATNGIETSMFTTGVVAACAAALAARDAAPRRRVLAGLLVGSVVSIRPEGLAVAAALAGFDVVARRDRLREASTWALVGGTLAWALPVWGGRRLYFGAWVPNTFSAKVHSSVGELAELHVKYLAMDWPFWACAAVLLLALAVHAIIRRDALAGPVVAIALGLVVVALRVPQWMPGGRMFVASVALGLCVAGARLGELAASDFRLGPVHGWRLAGIFLALAAGPLLSGPLPKLVRHDDGRRSPFPGSGAARAAMHFAAHAPPGSVLATRDAGVLAYFVGPRVRVAEIHERALAQPHPGGADADFSAYTPRNPHLLAIVVWRELQGDTGIEGDRRVLAGLTVPYVYLGRVHQHVGRHYDLYARADIGLPALPPDVVTNFAGPEPPIPANRR